MTDTTELSSPVRKIPDKKRAFDANAMGLSLSGGGYRAMLFHCGALLRLNATGLLAKLSRVSSVSGGSLVAARLGLVWDQLTFEHGVAADLNSHLVEPLRALASRTVDAGSILGGALMPGTIGDRVVKAYEQHLFGGKTLQDLTASGPRFIINATNVQSGVLWRFERDVMRDWRVGAVKNTQLKLAVAVAASSAFPPFLSPVVLELDEDAFTPGSGDGLQRPPYTTQVTLTDGGVYDNLGLETVWKRCGVVLVSDAGAPFDEEPEPKHDWPRHARRVVDIMDSQVRALRVRQVLDSFRREERRGGYWSLRTDPAKLGVPDAFEVSARVIEELSSVRTRLKAIESVLQERLINWGFATADTAIRRNLQPGPRPALPFAETGL